MRWEIKSFERGETGEDIRREGGEAIERHITGRQESGMKKQGSGQRRLFKSCQGSENIKHTIIKRLNRV